MSKVKCADVIELAKDYSREELLELVGELARLADSEREKWLGHLRTITGAAHAIDRSRLALFNHIKGSADRMRRTMSLPLAAHHEAFAIIRDGLQEIVDIGCPEANLPDLETLE